MSPYCPPCLLAWSDNAATRNEVMRKFIRLRIIALIMLLCSCSDKLPKDRKDNLYYLMASDRHEYIDTIPFIEFQQYDSADQFIAEERFSINKRNHIIKAFSSNNHAPADGGRFYYILDNIGVIYTRSTTWPTSIRLSSNNDSLNDLLSSAFARIMLKPLLHCYQCLENRSVQEQQWTPLIVKEDK